MKPQVPPKLEQLRTLLKYHQSLGIENYPLSDELRQLLDGALTMPEEGTDIVSPTAPAAQSATETSPSTAVPASMGEICEEVRECRSCALCRQRILPVCGLGGADQVKLLIVGGWLALSSSPESTNVLFGGEEDIMITRMLHAINLTEKEAFITNVIKCGIDTKVQPQAMHIDTCISYLERQIATLSPTVICTMGTVATRTLLKVRQPLSQLRGTFHDYRLNDQKTISLMPTYHPTFLLNSPEMKKPTWDDLQLIEKKLHSF